MLIDKKISINQFIQIFSIILLCSYPLSMSGIELGRYGILICWLLIFFIPQIKKLTQEDQPPLGFSFNPPLPPLTASNQSIPFYLKLEQRLRFGLPWFFITYYFFYTISFLMTPYWGNIYEGSFDHLPTFVLLSVVAWVAYRYLKLNCFWGIIYFLLIAFGITHIYSFWQVFYNGVSLSMGFYSYHIIYSKILAVEYTVIMVLIFSRFRGYLTAIKNQIMPWSLLFLILLLGLFLFDVSLNRSRSLIIVMVIIPILLFLFYHIKNIKLLSFIPFLLVFSLLFIPDTIKNRMVSSLNFYIENHSPLQIEKTNGDLRLFVSDSNAFYEKFNLGTFSAYLVTEDTNINNLYHGSFAGEYFFGRELGESTKGTYVFEFTKKEEVPSRIFVQTLVKKDKGVGEKRTGGKIDFQIIKNREEINAKPLLLNTFAKVNKKSENEKKLFQKTFEEFKQNIIPLYELVKKYPLSHIKINFFQNSRRLIYESTCSMIKKSPWIGNGPGTWKNFVTNIDRNDYAHLYINEPDNKHYHPHNNFLYIWYNSGMLTTCVLYSFFFLLILANGLFLFRKKNKGYKFPTFSTSKENEEYHIYLMSFFCFITLNLSGIFDNTIYDNVSGSILWFLIGVLMKFSKWDNASDH